jgi:SH3 domain protein
MSNLKTKFALLLVGLFCVANPALAADQKYITDEFEVTMRSGTSTSNSIVRMLKSGQPVTVLEEDLASQYSLVETEDNKKGYVLTRFLLDIPSARQRLDELQSDYERQQARNNEQKTEIESFNSMLAQEKSDNKALKNTLRASEKELSEIRNASQNALSILDHNKRLETVVEQLRKEKTELSNENLELKDTTKMDWFVRGGAVSLIAFVIGILITRIRWKKQDSWGSY